MARFSGTPVGENEVSICSITSFRFRWISNYKQLYPGCKKGGELKVCPHICSFFCLKGSPLVPISSLLAHGTWYVLNGGSSLPDTSFEVSTKKDLLSSAVKRREGSVCRLAYTAQKSQTRKCFRFRQRQTNAQHAGADFLMEEKCRECPAIC